MESFHTRGFTLVELLVVLAIIGVLSTVVLTSQSSFNKTLVVSNTAYDIALTLRSAETYGLSSRAANTSVNPVTNAGYGAHFLDSTQGSFIFFADTTGGASCTGMLPDCKPGDRIYTEDDTLVQTYVLGNNVQISDFCAYNGSWYCARDAQSGGISSLDVVFERPNPDARISSGGSQYTKACLTITSPQGGAKFIVIGSSGQIVANAPSDPSSCHDLSLP